MDFGAGDIVAGIKIIKYLFDNGLLEDNAADVRFKNFRNDVHNLASLLKKLDESLRNAHSRSQTRLVLDREPLDPLSNEFERERKAIVGNFKATLNECEVFLERRKKYATNQSNPVENLGWHLTSEEQRVDDLRQRIAFHMYKIRFVIDRLSFDTLTDLQANVDDTLALAEENLEVSNEVLYEITKLRSDLSAGQSNLQTPPQENVHFATPSIAKRFEESLGPVSYNNNNNNGSDLSLSSAFDGLLRALQQSNEGSDQTHETYVAFLKARWLMSKIEESKEYRDARPGFYFKRACKQIDRALKTKLRRPGGVIPYDEHSLLALPSACFTIWQAASAPVPNEMDFQLALPRGDEEEIAKIDLATDVPGATDKLTVLKRSDVQFRAVREMASPSSTHQIILPLQIDVREDNLVPRYLLPTLVEPCLEMSILSRDVENSYRFRDLDDLYALQSAFTGFEVSHDQGGITCQFSDNIKHIDCMARAQLWQEPVEVRDLQQAASPVSNDSAAAHSNSQAPTQASFAGTNTVVQTADGYEAQSIKHCAAVLFSKIRDSAGKEKFIIVFVELPEDSHIDESECSCRRDYDKCSKLVLVRKKKRPLPLRFRYCDLNSFDLLEFRLNSSFGKALRAETDYLVFKFATLEEKKQFHREMNLRFAVRNGQVRDQLNFGERFRQRQDRPQRPNQAIQQHARRRSSNVAGPTSPSMRTPQLPAIESGPTFASWLDARSSQGPSPLRIRLETPVATQSPPAQYVASSAAGLDSDSAIDMGDPEKWRPTNHTNETSRNVQSTTPEHGTRPDREDSFTLMKEIDKSEAMTANCHRSQHQTSSSPLPAISLVSSTNGTEGRKSKFMKKLFQR